MKGMELALEPPSGFELGTLGLGIQNINHQAIGTKIIAEDYDLLWFYNTHKKISSSKVTCILNTQCCKIEN